MSGRHVDPASSTFWRDLVFMILAIAGVAVLVFGGLWLFDRIGDDGTPATTTVPTTVPTTTTGETPTTTTTAPRTTTSTQPATTTTAAPEARPPSEVTVQVFNGTGVEGLAARVTEQLSDAGYRTLSAVNNPDGLVEVSRIWYQEGFLPEAIELSAAFPDALVEVTPDPAGPADLVVVLGASFEE
ncbi:MAG: LytR C-terminal domain-containing protein [Acidimicrobiia bacterium]|jgi:hypothetical protein